MLTMIRSQKRIEKEINLEIMIKKVRNLRKRIKIKIENKTMIGKMN